MKRITTLFMMMLTCINMMAQATEMTIDNQTPGWLSSKLTYAEQVALKKLTLTGYVNHADIVFVNKLISEYNLEWLDISDINIIEYGEDDYYGFIRCGSKTLKRIILPKSWNFTGTPVSGNVDTLTVLLKGSLKASCKYLDLLEGSECILNGTFSMPVNGKIGPLPLSLKIIENGAFVINTNNPDDIKCLLTEPFIFPNNIVRIGSEKIDHFGGGSWIRLKGKEYYLDYIIKLPISNKRFDFPDSLTIYNSSSWDVMSDYHTYYQKYSRDLFESDTISVGAKCSVMYAKLKANVAIFHSKTPPKQYRGDAYNTGDFNFGILYVPEGCSSAYKSAYTQYVGNQIGEIREMKSISSISITSSSPTLYVGETDILKANIYPSNAFDKTFYWQSSNDSIATVDKYGKVTAINTGVVTIRAVSKNGDTLGSCEITVLQHATSVSLSQSEIELNKIGESYQLQAIVHPENASNKKVNWITSNLGICHIGNDGNVTATGYGTAVVFATTDDGGYSASCTVHVIDTSSVSNIETAEGKIYVSEGKIMFSDSFAKHNVYIYSVTGIKMYSGEVKSMELPSGVYIIKISNKILKIKI